MLQILQFIPIDNVWFWLFVASVCFGSLLTASREWHIVYITKQARGLQEILGKVADNLSDVEIQLKDETKEIKDSLRELRNMVFSAALGRFGINISGGMNNIGETDVRGNQGQSCK